MFALLRRHCRARSPTPTRRWSRRSPPARRLRRPRPARCGCSRTGFGDQGAWMLVFALLGMIAIALTRPARRDPRLAGLIVFGGFFLCEAVFLSFSNGIVHPYYVSALAPGTAAMVGAGASPDDPAQSPAVRGHARLRGDPDGGGTGGAVAPRPLHARMAVPADPRRGSRGRCGAQGSPALAGRPGRGARRPAGGPDGLCGDDLAPPRPGHVPGGGSRTRSKATAAPVSAARSSPPTDALMRLHRLARWQRPLPAADRGLAHR